MKPALFNTEMVRAILDGRKTVTRRKPFQMEKGYSLREGIYLDAAKRPCALFEKKEDGMMFVQYVRAPYAPGDILYVRETWAKLWYVDPDGYTHYDQPMYYYAADGTPDITLCDGDGFELDDQRIRWRPSIHMPKEAARLFLRVKAVRVERLHDMTATDMVNEGMDAEEVIHSPWKWHELWNSTIKPADRAIYGWAANPWVWVIEFERVTREEAENG